MHRRWEGLETRLIFRLESELWYKSSPLPMSVLSSRWNSTSPCMRGCDHLYYNAISVCNICFVYLRYEGLRDLGPGGSLRGAQRYETNQHCKLQHRATCRSRGRRYCNSDSNRASGRIWVWAPPYIWLQRVTNHASVTRISGGMVCDLRYCTDPNSGIHSLDTSIILSMGEGVQAHINAKKLWLQRVTKIMRHKNLRWCVSSLTPTVVFIAWIASIILKC